MPGTFYAVEVQREILFKFLEKFKQDARPFALKLKTMRMSKGTYSYLLNGCGEKTSKKVLETMRAYLEDREPKWALPVSDPEFFYCFSCELIKDIARRQDRWTCGDCSNEINRNLRAKNPALYDFLRKRWRKENRERFLKQRQRQYLRKTYGKLAGCVELINEIKKEYTNASEK